MFVWGWAGSQTVRARIIDKDGGFTEYTTAVTIANVNPTATFPSTRTVDEGSSSSFAFTAPSDPSTADTSAGFHYAYACDGGSLESATYTGSGTSATKECTFADDGTHTVRARIIDKDGGFTEYTTDVTVDNVAPTAELGNDGPVDEGSPATVSFSAQSDPSTADTSAGFHYAYACDGGSLESATYAGSGTSASKECTFDDDGTHTVRARIIDKDGGFTEYTTAVTVENVAPTATFPSTRTVNEGSSSSFAFTAPSDPSEADTEAGFHYAYACDGGSLESATYAGSGTSASKECTFADDGTHTVRARIIDKDGGFTEYTTAVTVENVAPTATFPSTRTVNEGSSSSFAFTAPSDPSEADTEAGFHYAYARDGASLESATYAGAGTSASKECTFDDDGTHTVRARIIDKDGGFTEYTTAVTVENVAPTATFPSTRTVNEGSSSSFAFTSPSDPSTADTSAGFHYAFSCSGASLDGATYAGSGTSATTNCSFGDGPGSQTVRARIIDKDGGFTEYTTAVTILNVDPTAELGNDGPVDEGSAATISFTNQSDPSAADTSAGFHYAFSCTNGSLAGETYASSGTPSSRNCTFGDDGTRTVRARIIDKNNGFTEYTTEVTVDNVNPTASNASFTLNPVTGTATAGFDFSDVGWLDTHGSSFFTWSHLAGNQSASLSDTENNAPDATGHASDTQTLDPGCYDLTVTGTAKDDNGGQSAALPIYSNSAASVYGKGFRPPIMDNERNIAKYGNVVPVKVVLTNTCTGATVTNVPLFITVHLGTGGEAFDETSLITESVSAADTGNQMRTADGMYIYNLSTKTLIQGKDYAIRIRPNTATAPWILQAVLYPKRVRPRGRGSAYALPPRIRLGNREQPARRYAELHLGVLADVVAVDLHREGAIVDRLDAGPGELEQRRHLAVAHHGAGAARQQARDQRRQLQRGRPLQHGRPTASPSRGRRARPPGSGACGSR